MNMILVFIILIVVLGFAVLGSRFMNKMPIRQRNYSYSKRIRRIFAGYLILLVTCFLLDFLFPHNQMSDWKMVSTTQVEKESQGLYDAALKGKIDQVNRKFLKKEWKFDYSDKTLSIDVKNGEIPNIMVIADRKNTNDGKIEAFYYRTTTTMNDLDITDFVKAPGMSIEGKQITLLKPERRKLKMSEFNNVFSINRFTGGSSFKHQSAFFEGGDLLYIKIPQELQLVNRANINIVYVK